jgi:hypothetical protein
MVLVGGRARVVFAIIVPLYLNMKKAFDILFNLHPPPPRDDHYPSS